MMIPLDEVDPKRVADVNSGKMKQDRGGGKTIAKMVELLSYAQPYNAGKCYIFIGESQMHVEDISRTFQDWLLDYTASKKDAYMIPKTKLQCLARFCNTFYYHGIVEQDIEFDFISASCIRKRDYHGKFYDAIVEDTTYEAWNRNYHKLSMVYERLKR